jgi:hypothetical protein
MVWGSESICSEEIKEAAGQGSTHWVSSLIHHDPTQGEAMVNSTKNPLRGRTQDKLVH